MLPAPFFPASRTRGITTRPGAALSLPGVVVWFALCVQAAAVTAPEAATITAFRIRDMDLRDPHTYFSFIGCRDLTDNSLLGYSFNSQLQTELQSDSTGDGLLDLNMLLLFEPADPAGPGGMMIFATGAPCTAPLASTSCGPIGPGNWTLLSTIQPPAGACLSPVAGTLKPYSPSVVSPSAPCFVSDPANLVLPVGGEIALSLTSAQIAATFVGNPPTQLVNGLILGFLSETVANTTILPVSYPIAGGQPLSVLLPGGDPAGIDVCCASHSDKDAAPGGGGGGGWWVYFNFVASAVPYSGTALAVPIVAPAAGALEVSPNPAFGSAAIAFEVAGDEPVRVAIHDLMGRRVRELESGSFSPGTHRTTWDGRTSAGQSAPAGLYVVRCSGGGRVATRNFLLIR